MKADVTQVSSPAKRYEFGDFVLDADRRQLSKHGQALALTQKALEALLYLAERPGQLIGKADLLKAIWPNTVVEENNLNQVISTLRRALGENPGEQRYIVTVPGRGYQFIAPVQAVNGAESLTSNGVIRPAASVAVLPFANLTGDASKEYLSDGLADELIHLLARVPKLKVPSRTSSFAYKGRNTDIRTIATDLGVSMVLEGSVRSAGERIRVTAQLIDAHSGFHVWSESYDRRFGDLFELQDELAGAIARALGLAVDPDAASLPASFTQSIEAYQLYLQGSALMRRAGADALKAGIRYLENAIAIDPKFVRAYTELSMAQHLLVSIDGATEQLMAASEENAQRALALNANLPDVYMTLSHFSMNRARWLESHEYYRKARALEPSGPELYDIQAQLLLAPVGHLRESLNAIREAYRLAPAQPVYAMGMATASIYMNQYADALAYTQLAADLGMPRSTPPLPFVDAAIAMSGGHHAKAAECINAMLDPLVLTAGGAAAVQLIYAAAAGATDKHAALDALRTLRKGAARSTMERPIMMMLSTVWFTQLGAVDDAYELTYTRLGEFEKTGVLSGAIFVSTNWLPEMRPFRQDPRFQDYATRIGLMDYWTKYGPPDGCELKNGRLICH
jgi:TolB-like protein